MMTLTADRGYLSDGDIIAEERTSGGVSETIWYAYSGSGSLVGFIYDGEDYYYRKNLEGDITGIYDDAGNLKVTYTYDMYDSNYVLCKFSNRLSIAANAHGAAVVNSNPTTYSVQMTETISSDYYGSTSRAMKAYANNRTYYDYIPFYNIYSYDKKYSKAVYVPNPLAGPGQIY